MNTLILILLVAGLACFIIAVVGRFARTNLVALGLACWISTEVLARLS